MGGGKLFNGVGVSLTVSFVDVQTETVYTFTQ